MQEPRYVKQLEPQKANKDQQKKKKNRGRTTNHDTIRHPNHMPELQSSGTFATKYRSAVDGNTSENYWDYHSVKATDRPTDAAFCCGLLGFKIPA